MDRRLHDCNTEMAGGNVGGGGSRWGGGEVRAVSSGAGVGHVATCSLKMESFRHMAGVLPFLLFERLAEESDCTEFGCLK